jgi:ABC-type proline/glycine betaine transport system permease subunit
LSLLYSPVGTTQIVVGTVVSVALAVIVDLALVGVQRIVTPWSRQRAAA